MYINTFIFFLCLSLPLSYELTPAVSFELYIECLETNPLDHNALGLPLTAFAGDTWDLHNFHTTNPQDHPTEYIWQVYPNPEIEPIRPAEPPTSMPYYRPRFLAAGRCTNLLLDVCCRTVGYLASDGKFSHLPRGAISAFWGPEVYLALPTETGREEPNPYGCATGDARVLDSRYDVPQWAYRDKAWLPRITGASYISCPSNGIKRGWGAVLQGFCASLKRRRSEGGGGDTGVLAAPPEEEEEEEKRTRRAEALRSGEAVSSSWVWPNLMTVDGVDYTDDRRGDLLYYSSGKRLLNFARFRH